MSSSSRRVFHLFLLVLVLLTSPLFILFTQVSYAVAKQTASYYDILKLEPDATLQDIKKSYRKLAMEYHPDRNRGNEEESTLKFRQVSEAYEVLSDDSLRRKYDRDLKSGRTGHAGAGRGEGEGSWSTTYRERYRQHARDPFAQFDDLFHNDPFFREAFDGMDDLFAKTFQNGARGYAGRHGSNPATSTQHRNKPRGWGEWAGRVADKLGVNVEFSTTTTSSGTSSVNGRETRSSHSSSSSSSRSSWSGGGGGSGATYTSRSTRTVIENGKRVTIQSLEKDGNRIEERYDGRTLVGRKINGVPERIEQIAGDDL